MDILISSLCEKLIESLRDDETYIPAWKIQHMEQLAEHMVVYCVKKTVEALAVDLWDDTGKVVERLTTQCISQVIDVPPIWRDGQWHMVYPTIIIAGEKDRASLWTMIHEICHLLSIGPYVRIGKNCWQHSFGSFVYQYQLDGKRTIQRRSEGHDGINELLTDYTTWYFMRELFGAVEPRYAGLERFRVYADSQEADGETATALIGAYFTGNTLTIRKLLLNQRYESYRDLYEALQTLT
jgi:hypothetical protein